MTAPNPSPQSPPHRGAIPTYAMTLLVVAAIVVGGLVLTLVVTSTLSVSTKSIAPYSISQGSNNPSSVTVTDVNGGITVNSWSLSSVLVNGTVTARGYGASTDAITFIESNTNGALVFQVVFPNNNGLFLNGGYTVDINVYVPSSAHYSSAQFTTTNGVVQVSSINAATLTLTTTNGKVQAVAVTSKDLALKTTNGEVDFTCASCSSVTANSVNGGITGTFTSPLVTGSVVIDTTNGSISLTLPAISSFNVTASNVNGSISTSGFSSLSAQASHSLTGTVGAGVGTVNVTTVNGSITIAGS